MLRKEHKSEEAVSQIGYKSMDEQKISDHFYFMTQVKDKDINVPIS